MAYDPDTDRVADPAARKPGTRGTRTERCSPCSSVPLGDLRMSHPARSVAPVLTFAGHDVEEAQALTALRAYADEHPATINWYDYAGTDAPPVAADGVQLADIGRLVVINAQLSADDVPGLLAPLPDGLWDAVPHDADFRDLSEDPHEHPVYVAASKLYEALISRHNIARTKATKLLHLKRPQLIPVVDSVAAEHYRRAADDLAARWGEPHGQFWAAIWADARANEEALQPLLGQLAGEGRNRARLAALSPLRLHDVLVWSLFRRVAG